MSALFLPPGGALITYRVEIAACRWGGGAEPGKTHVFSCCGYGWFFGSHQCVTDDFGNLVEVSS